MNIIPMLAKFTGHHSNDDYWNDFTICAWIIVVIMLTLWFIFGKNPYPEQEENDNEDQNSLPPQMPGVVDGVHILRADIPDRRNDSNKSTIDPFSIARNNIAKGKKMGIPPRSGINGDTW